MAVCVADMAVQGIDCDAWGLAALGWPGGVMLEEGVTGTSGQGLWALCGGPGTSLLARQRPGRTGLLVSCLSGQGPVHASALRGGLICSWVNGWGLCFGWCLGPVCSTLALCAQRAFLRKVLPISEYSAKITTKKHYSYVKFPKEFKNVSFKTVALKLLKIKHKVYYF